MTISSRTIFFLVIMTLATCDQLHACLSKYRVDNVAALKCLTCNELTEMIHAKSKFNLGHKDIEDSMQNGPDHQAVSIQPIQSQSPEQIKKKISQLLTIIACNKMQRTVLNEHAAPIKIMCFCPTHGNFASVDTNNIIKIWDLNNNTCTATFPSVTSQAGWVTDLCFSHCGTMLALGLRRGGPYWDDPCIEIWRRNEHGNGWTFLCRFGRAHFGSIQTLCFAPDGTLASGSWDGAIRIWRIEDDRLIFKAALDGHTNKIDSLCFYGNNRLASSSWDGRIKIWNKRYLWGDSDTWECLSTLENDSRFWHSDVFNFDEKYVSYFLHGNFEVWDFHNDACKTLLKGLGFVNSIRVCSDDTILGFGDRLQLWEPADTGYENILADNPIKDFCCCPAPACFSQDGKTLAYADLCSGTITILNLTGLLAVRRFLKHPIRYDLAAYLELFTDEISLSFPEMRFGFLPDEIKQLVLGL